LCHSVRVRMKYFSEGSINSAIRQARDVMKDRVSESPAREWGHTDCWSFVVLYDKFLRGSSTPLEDLNLDYNNYKEFLSSIASNGYPDFDKFAKSFNYEKITNKRPRHGDIAYTMTRDGLGTAIIADCNWWITSSGNTGVIDGRRVRPVETTLEFLARPII
jgi:hypothetical protein